MTDWNDVAADADLLEDEALACDGPDGDITLYRVQGQVYATQAMCTHGNARLCDGYLEGHEIECPLHQGRFDVRTGAIVCGPMTRPLQTYETRIQDGRIWLRQMAGVNE